GVAIDRSRLQAVATGDLVGELRAVGGVADGAGEDGRGQVAALGLDRLVILVQDGEHAVDRLARQGPAGVHPRPEARDSRAAVAPRAAPAIQPSRSPRASASWSTTPPRAVLTR